jgi:Bacterial Ig-like domain
VTVPAATRTVVSNALEAAPAEALPAAPSLTDIAVNSNDSVTLKGTAVDGSTVTVWSTTGTNDGTTTASTSGAWSFTTPDLLPGVYGYTATDTTSAGTSVKSNALGVTVPAQSFSANGNQYGEEINLSATSDELDLSASAVTVTRGSGTESLLAGSSDFPFSSSDYRSTETIDAQPGDHFVFNPGFGHETIQGFQAMGSEADTLQLSISSFSYLNVGMSQAADLAALLTHSTGGTSATTITDSSGDTLTLAGLSRTTIAADAAANPSLVKFV